jgi:hypothetical protein
VPTGALIRDFHKEYRELRFTTSGSFELSEIEHNAYLQRLTVQIDEIDSQRYLNKKTLPDHSHYGYLTMFKGTSVIERLPIEFPKQRVFERINQGLWNYHQQTESLVMTITALSKTMQSVANAIIERADEGWGTADICKLNRFLDTFEDPLDPLAYFIIGCSDDLPSVQTRDVSEYRGFPVASPFPDIFKFKGDIPLSFRFRLESWYLVNPVIYIVDNPTDTDDETEGEDEYPEPEVGDGDGAGDEFPEPDPIPSGRDSRDFPDGAGSSDWFPGARVRIRYTRLTYTAGCVPLDAPDEIELGSTGPGEYSFEFIGSVSGCGGPSTPGGLRLVTPSGARVDIAVLEEQQRSLATVDSVVYFTP